MCNSMGNWPLLRKEMMEQRSGDMLKFDRGGSGTGVGNLLCVGPLDMNLKLRNSTWLQKADILFVDNPVGAGFSYVEDESLFVSSDEEAATDLTTLLKELFNKDKRVQTSPLFIVGESYGGRFAVTIAVSVLKAIQSRELKLRLGGVALGDAWISPEDYVFSWGPLLKDLSRLDDNGLKESDSLAQLIKQQIQKGLYKDATDSWFKLKDVIGARSNSVDLYNFLLDNWSDPYPKKAMRLLEGISMKKYSSYLYSKDVSSGQLSNLMNGVIREKLKIIPKNVSWGGQADMVYSSLSNGFMKSRINEVDELLSNEVNVTIYNGQLDLICATRGTEAWVQKLKWNGLKNFTNLDRTPLYCNNDQRVTKGFRKSYKNLNFYWILGASHFVPVEQPCIALQMIGEITHSPVPTFRQKKNLKGHNFKM
ncbi:hypothetical protein MRB53_031352 [Persea americana]|uniref:Uncharacterized protein n=1 Tax=Persea americana TaxID=3435 RepID=A0ACC2KNT8_PERAE|nr:hypothetical protein MRB53_031352 [Persea americana]